MAPAKPAAAAPVDAQARPVAAVADGAHPAARPRSLAERYGNPAARLNIDAAVQHAQGCRLEFWRALAARGLVEGGHGTLP